VLGFSAVIALSTVLINLAKVNNHTLFSIVHWRMTPSALALAIAALFLLAGLTHTFIRYYGPASAFLPADVVRGPVLSGSLSDAEAENILRDPAYWVKSGYLPVIQADTATTLRDLRGAGYDLVVFIDDLDRCDADTTVEVFQAVNLFLSGTTDLDAKFVMGLDPAVVAAHLDSVYQKPHGAHFPQYGDDPSAGWAFLRKVVQLPVGAPRISDSAIDQFLGAALEVPPEIVRNAVSAFNAHRGANKDKEVVQAARPLPAKPDHKSVVPEEESRTGFLERQPEIVALIRERLIAQPDRSAREAKRLLNVWQLYQRVLDLIVPLSDDEEVVRRACHLVILAEIVTRWPALQRQLHGSWDGQRGLQLLAAACEYDQDWDNVLKVVGLDQSKHRKAVTNLREVLRTREGIAVADLAAMVL